MQNAKFPMEVLRVTQGYGFSVDGVSPFTFSHSKEYALDLGGRDGGQDWLYAPFDCVVKRIYGIYNAVWFQSTDKVMCADGVARILIMMCLHMNNSDKNALGLYVGKRFAQGQRCYREGTAGYATGNHVHMEIGSGPFTGSGWHAEGSQWVINNKLIPSKVLFLGKDVIQANPVYKWTVERKDEGTVTPPSGTFVSVTGKEIEIRANNVEYFNTTSVAVALGKLPYGARYQMTAKSTGKINGWDWVKFIKDGKEYYTAIVSDNRFVIVDASSGGNTGAGTAKGTKFYLNGTLYPSSTAKTGRAKKGTYYVYDGVKMNGRYRVTNAASNVGKTPVGTYVSGYVDASVLGDTSDSSGFSAGQKVFVSGTLFASSKATRGTYKQGNYYWVYDGQVENGRMRVTNSATNVGKTPAGIYVSGWVALSAMRKA